MRYWSCPPLLETNSKIRGTNFDAGGVKPFPFPPHVPCLFHPFQDHHALERHYTWLTCPGAEFWELKLCCLVGLHLLLGYTWCNISRFIIHSSHRKWPPSPPHFYPWGHKPQKVGVNAVVGVCLLVYCPGIWPFSLSLLCSGYKCYHNIESNILLATNVPFYPAFTRSGILEAIDCGF